MQKGWFVAIVLLTLLILPTALADCYATNFCDVGYDNRYRDAADDASNYYLSKNTQFTDGSTPAAYPAAVQPLAAGAAVPAVLAVPAASAPA